jgi:hypothetical protein
MKAVTLNKLYTAEHTDFKGVHSYVDDNGELFVTAPAATHKVVNIKQAEGYKRRLVAEKTCGRNHDFTLSNMQYIAEIGRELDDKYCGYLLYLQCFIGYESGAIVNADKTPMSRQQIQKTLGLKETAFKAFMKEMNKYSIIVQCDSSYRINEKFHFKGTTSNTQVIKSFTAKVKELYKTVSAKDLGFIYKLLPHVHLKTNTICSNPYETDETKTIPLSKGEIATLTGVSEKTVYNKLNKLILDGQYVFAELEGTSQFAYYRINPFIFYRKNGRPDASLVEMFAIKARSKSRKRGEKENAKN